MAGKAQQKIGRIEKVVGKWSPQRTFGGVGKEANMLWTVFVILLVLWGLGLVTSYTMGGFIHVLLVIAIVVVLVQVIQGRRRS